MKKVKALSISVLLLCCWKSFSQQLKLGDQPTVGNKAVVLNVQGSNNMQGLWLPRVSDTSITGIRSLNPPDGLIIYHTPFGKLFLRSNSSWITYTTSSAVSSITSGGQSLIGPAVTFQTGSSGSDYNIVADNTNNTVTYNLPDASASARGAVTANAQTFGGVKTFSNGAVVAGATGSVSNLQLGITSSTTPGTLGNNVLSVNRAGNIVLAPIYKNFQVSTSSAVTIAQSSSTTFTFNITGANLKTTGSTVIVTPSTTLAGGCGVGWAVVTSATQIQASYFSGYTSQSFPVGYKFYITVIEF
jgi:hypothetical protein